MRRFSNGRPESGAEPGRARLTESGGLSDAAGREMTAGRYVAGMARGRPWTKAEDKELRLYARNVKRLGILSYDVTRSYPRRPLTAESYRAGLRAFAERYDRTYAAVRKRASRLGIRSYPVDYWIWK